MRPLPSAVLLPGGILPAGPAYTPLLDQLPGQADARAKDLEIYAGASLPADYSLDLEVEGIARFADEAGFDTFHLVGYSAGGASCLAFLERYPERLRSLALFEPAWAGWHDMTVEEHEVMVRFRDLRRLPAEQVLPAFIRLQLAPGVEPPPPVPGPPPAWMASRPAGIAAFLSAFFATDLNPDRLRDFTGPVYFGLGGRSNPDYYARMAERLAAMFPDFTLERYPDRHHFDPPHRIEPERVAAALLAHWSRADAT